MALAQTMRARLAWCTAITLALAAGCTAGPATDGPSSPAEDVGIVHDELSDDFTLTVFPSTVYRDGEDIYLSLRATVVNKSSDAYEDFFTTVVFDPGLDQFLAAGAEPLPLSKVDLFPVGAPELEEGSGALGTELIVDQLLSSRQFLDEAGLEPARILDLAENLTLTLRWDGREETLEYSVPVTDPDNLLGS